MNSSPILVKENFVGPMAVWSKPRANFTWIVTPKPNLKPCGLINSNFRTSQFSLGSIELGPIVRPSNLAMSRFPSHIPILSIIPKGRGSGLLILYRIIIALTFHPSSVFGADTEHINQLC
jgi:hypothetical protein